MKQIGLNEKIFIAGANGMAGAAIYRALKRHGYGSHENGGNFLIPDRHELNLLDLKAIENWFLKVFL